MFILQARAQEVDAKRNEYRSTLLTRKFYAVACLSACMLLALAWGRDWSVVAFVAASIAAGCAAVWLYTSTLVPRALAQYKAAYGEARQYADGLRMLDDGEI